MRPSALGWTLCVVALAAGVGCTRDPGCIVPEGIDPTWIRSLGCAADFDRLAAERDDAVFSHTRSVNWLIDREDDDHTYFIDTDRYPLHYHFAAEMLNLPGKTPVGTHGEFNLLNYRRPNRRFVLGKLIHYVDQDLVTLEFSAGDNADAEMIVFAFRRISEEIYNADELLYRPVSGTQERFLPDLQEIPTIRTEDVFLGQVFQALNPGTAFGTLRFAHTTELYSQPLLPTEIVVLDRVPNDIAMVSAIITAEFQTPLSHINLLSINRGTPNMALRDAMSDPALRALEGLLIQLEVDRQGFHVQTATPEEAQSYWDQLRPSGTLTPLANLDVEGVVEVRAATAADSLFIGAKAANLAELYHLVTAKLRPIALPDAPIALPFSAYVQHITASGLDAQIDAVVAAAPTLDPAELRARLFALRWAIYRAPIDPELLEQVTQAIESRWSSATRVRFRSSTNVEDLPDFSGAGLYTSASASLEEGSLAIANAIRSVWASAWNDQAFIERDFYRVDHRRIAMAVLMHPAFSDELANGVVATINHLNPQRPAFFINAQVGDVSVTNPTGLAIPEQLLYYTWYEEAEYEVITRSSLAASLPGGAVLSDEDLSELEEYLGVMHQHFRTLFGGDSTFALDVEFKKMADRGIVIKQARPLARHEL